MLVPIIYLGVMLHVPAHPTFTQQVYTTVCKEELQVISADEHWSLNNYTISTYATACTQFRPLPLRIPYHH